MAGLTVAFDLDGTLVDTAPDLIGATNHTLATIGLGPVPGDEIRAVVSYGARRMIERGLAMARSPAPADRRRRPAGALSLLLRRQHCRRQPALSRSDWTLHALAARGARLAVCTNKREDLSRLLLDRLGLASRFAAICGRDTFPVCKPHPDHLTRTITQAGGVAGNAVMVGDSDTDLNTARAAGIPFIGVSFGYTAVPMRDLGPDVLIDHYDDFHAALDVLVPGG